MRLWSHLHELATELPLLEEGAAELKHMLREILEPLVPVNHVEFNSRLALPIDASHETGAWVGLLLLYSSYPIVA